MPSTDPKPQYPPDPTGYPGPVPDPPQPAFAPQREDDEETPISQPDTDDL